MKINKLKDTVYTISEAKQVKNQNYLSNIDSIIKIGTYMIPTKKKYLSR